MLDRCPRHGSIARAGALIATGDVTDGRRLADEAARLAGQTDSLELRGQAQAALGAADLARGETAMARGGSREVDHRLRSQGRRRLGCCGARPPGGARWPWRGGDDVSTKILTITTGAATDPGMVRAGNEDAYLVAPPLYVVADGMGGHRAGEVAARLAVTALSTRGPDIAAGGAEALLDAMREANGIILRSSQEDDRLRGMATTCTAAIVRGRVARIAHVGDSRAYLFHEGRLSQLTDDHSVVAQLVREGYLTPDEAAVHPRRNVIMRALGSIEDVEIDTTEAILDAGDRLLLCSDGLTNCLNDSAIAALLGDGRDAQSTAARLVERANAAGGPDNITVVIVDVRAMSS